jgi:hypothetical protein
MVITKDWLLVNQWYAVESYYYNDNIKREKEKDKHKMVYLTYGLAELEEGAGLYPRMERIFFECSLVALIKACHFSVFILFISPAFAQSTFCWLSATKAMVPSMPIFKFSRRRARTISSSGMKHLVRAAKVFG